MRDRSIEIPDVLKQRIYEIVRQVPAGRVNSYGDIAIMVGGGIDAWTIGVTLACAAAAALAFGTFPAVHLSRGIVASALKADGRTGAGPGRQRLRRALVVAEIALALPLLVAAMLSVRSVNRYLADWQGYDPNGLLTFKLVLPQARDAPGPRRQVHISRYSPEWPSPIETTLAPPRSTDATSRF